jgi:hypothetical protein
MMSWMMDKALEAQEAQKAAQQPQNGLTTASKAGTNGTATERVKKKGSDPQEPRAVPTTTMEYASDVKHRGNVRVSKNGHSTNGNGTVAENGTPTTPITPTQLPRKKKNKK